MGARTEWAAERSPLAGNPATIVAMDTARPVRTLSLLAVAVVSVLAVVGVGIRAVVDSPNGPRECESATGSVTDLDAEPPYSADYLHRWHTAEGCLVRLDVVMLRAPGGDYHCAPWPPDILLGDQGRNYVGSPEPKWWHESVEGGFSADAKLPDDAVDSGFEREGTELWLAPDDGSAIYLVRADGAVERWPRMADIGCG